MEQVRQGYRKAEKSKTISPSPVTMKLLCDQMLGSLATWLRILGVDTFFPETEMTDEQILQIAVREDRLLISRDKELIARGKKRGLPVLGLQTMDIDEQLAVVLKTLPIQTDALLTRCTVCNSLLLSVPKTSVKDKVPPKVYASQENFWYCPHCEKYYWMGSHYQNMMQKINRLSQQTDI